MVKLLQKDSIKWTNCPGSVELEQSTRKLESNTDNEIRELAKKIVSLKMNYLLNRKITNVEAQTRKILEDDNYTIVASTDGTKVFYDKENPRCEIYIEKLD